MGSGLVRLATILAQKKKELCATVCHVILSTVTKITKYLSKHCRIPSIKLKCKGKVYVIIIGISPFRSTSSLAPPGVWLRASFDGRQSLSSDKGQSWARKGFWSRSRLKKRRNSPKNWPFWTLKYSKKPFSWYPNSEANRVGGKFFQFRQSEV